MDYGAFAFHLEGLAAVKAEGAKIYDGAAYPTRRSFMNVDADGTVATEDEEEHVGGEIAALRHGGSDLLGHYSAREVLEASTPLPPRMLLAYAVQTLGDRRTGALAEALAHATVALLPVLLSVGLLLKMGASKGFGLCSLITALLWVMLRAFWKEGRAPEKAWRLSEWLDFENRTWNSRKSFLDGTLPDRTASIPFDRLTLVCFVHQWEQGDSYDVGLCKATELQSCEGGDPQILNVVHSSSEESQAHAFGRALAALWGIDCWAVRYDLGMRKYCKSRV